MAKLASQAHRTRLLLSLFLGTAFITACGSPSPHPSRARQPPIPQGRTLKAAATPTPQGLRVTYFAGTDLAKVLTRRTEAALNFDWGLAEPVAGAKDAWSLRAEGQVLPQYSQTYTFTTTSDDGVRLWVNGQKIIDNWTPHSAAQNSGTIALKAGQKADLKIEYFDSGQHAVLKLAWASASQAAQLIPTDRLFPAGGVPSDGKGITARRAADFVDTIGVNAHFERIRDSQTIWHQQSAALRQKLLDSGIGHVRTSHVSGMSEGDAYLTYLQSLSNIKVDLQTNWNNDLASLPGIASRLGGRLFAIEAVNEPDIQGWVKADGRSNWWPTSGRSASCAATTRRWAPSNFTGRACWATRGRKRWPTRAALRGPLTA